MMKSTMWTLTLIATLALANVAGAATAEEKCQNKKLLALGKLDLCLQKERGKEVLGRRPNAAGCAAKFARQVAAADRTTPCRWLDNGDGTATDLNSGLQWELKTDDGSIHDKDDVHSWSGPSYGTTNLADGTAFTDFLGILNGGESLDGETTTSCFADKCDWRLATVEELTSIHDLSAPGCGSGPCTTIPGETALAFHWSSSTFANDPLYAWTVHFGRDDVSRSGKIFGGYPVRAVRGGR